MLARDLPCVVLGIDPGMKRAGWCIYDPARRWVELGATGPRDVKARESVIADALWRAKTACLPLIVVGETWRVSGDDETERGRRQNRGKDRRWNSQTIAGLGAAWGLWLAELYRLNVPDRRILRVDTGTWRKDMFGRIKLTTEAAIEHAAVRTLSMFQRVGVPGARLDELRAMSDEVNAACMAAWAIRSESARDAIGVRELAKQKWSETG